LATSRTWSKKEGMPFPRKERGSPDSLTRRGKKKKPWSESHKIYELQLERRGKGGLHVGVLRKKNRLRGEGKEGNPFRRQELLPDKEEREDRAVCL